MMSRKVRRVLAPVLSAGAIILVQLACVPPQPEPAETDEPVEMAEEPPAVEEDAAPPVEVEAPEEEPAPAGDTDGDGLPDDEEEAIGTDPFHPDSDEDGLLDGQEIFEVGTDPLAFDTDGDGFGDGDEALGFGSDPLNSADNPEAGEGLGVAAPDPGEFGAAAGDVPEHLLWGGFGAGDIGEGCGDGIPNVNVYVNDGGPPDADYSPDAGVIGVIYDIHGCDYPPGEMIRVRFSLPDGTIIQANDQIAEVEPGTEWGGTWYVPWWSLPGEPLGTYVYDVESASGTYSGTFEVGAPYKPLLLVSCGYQLAKGSVLLTGFVPGEEIALGMYTIGDVSTPSDLVASWRVTIGPDGTAITTAPFVMEGYGIFSFRQQGGVYEETGAWDEFTCS